MGKATTASDEKLPAPAREGNPIGDGQSQHREHCADQHCQTDCQPECLPVHSVSIRFGNE